MKTKASAKACSKKQAADQSPKIVNYIQERFKMKERLEKSERELYEVTKIPKIAKPKDFSSHQEMADYINKYLTPNPNTLRIDFPRFITAIEDVVKHYKHPQQFYDMFGIVPDGPAGYVEVLKKPKPFSSHAEMVQYFDLFMITHPSFAPAETSKILKAMENVVKAYKYPRTSVRDVDKSINESFLFALSNPAVTFSTIARLLPYFGLKLVCQPMTEQDRAKSYEEIILGPRLYEEVSKMRKKQAQKENKSKTRITNKK